MLIFYYLFGLYFVFIIPLVCMFFLLFNKDKITKKEKIAIFFLILLSIFTTFALILMAIIYLPYNKFYLYSLVLVSIENIVVPIVIFILFLFKSKQSTQWVYSFFVDIIKKK